MVHIFSSIVTTHSMLESRVAEDEGHPAEVVLWKHLRKELIFHPPQATPVHSIVQKITSPGILGDGRNEVHSGPLPNIREEAGIGYKQLKSGELGGTPLHRAHWSHDLLDFSVFGLQVAFSAKRFKDRTHFPPFFCHNITAIRFSWVYSEEELVKRNVAQPPESRQVYSTSQVCSTFL